MCLILVCLLSPAVIYGAEKTAEKEQALPEVLVESERLVEDQDKITIKPEGLPAKVNIVTKEDLKKTPYTGDYMDMFRNIPGVYTSKLNGDYGDRIGMRGFYPSNNQVAIFVDGMPMNLFDYRLSGWGDISWVIPEMIERIEVIKGPFSALYGDFALGGVINIITKKSDPSPSVGAYGGTYGTCRAVGVASDPSWSESLRNVTPFLVWEGYTRGGYRTNNDSNRGQFFNKFTFPLWQGNLSARVHYVSRTWGDPGWLKISDLKAGKVSRTSAVNDIDRGDSEMADVVLNYAPKGGEAGFHGTLYYAYHGHNTGRTYTWISTNPSQTRTDTFENYFGWKLLYDYRPFEQLSLVVGNDLRYDYVSLNQWYALKYYNLLQHLSSYKINRFNTGFFAQGQYKPFSFFKILGGVRYDMFNIDVDNKLYPQNSGTASPDIWSPKVGVVITPYKDINIFANQGRGFRSPSNSELSPASKTQKANFDIGVAKLETWDVGINALLLKRLFVSFNYYNTRYMREQMYNSLTQTYENLGASKRTGIEVEARIFVTKELTLYGSWSDVRARLKNPQNPGQFYIAELPEDQAVVGLEFQKPWGGGDHQLNFDFYYLRIGRAPLQSSGTPIGSQFDQYRSKLGYRYKNWTMSVDATFTPRQYASDACASFYNEPWILTWPRWEVLGGVKYQFK
ncbi:MAG: TonB-dependent receptor [Thermodesulfobacteriota bacterium]